MPCAILRIIMACGLAVYGIRLVAMALSVMPAASILDGLPVRSARRPDIMLLGVMARKYTVARRLMRV